MAKHPISDAIQQDLDYARQRDIDDMHRDLLARDQRTLDEVKAEADKLAADLSLTEHDLRTMRDSRDDWQAIAMAEIETTRRLRDDLAKVRATLRHARLELKARGVALGNDEDLPLLG